MDISKIEVAVDPLKTVNIWENGQVRMPHDEDEELSVLLTLAVARHEATEAAQVESFRALTNAIANGLVVESCQDGRNNDAWDGTEKELRERQVEASRIASSWTSQWEHTEDEERHFVGCGHRISNSSLQRQGF